jgi:multidrug efflux pump subunit AcrB
MRWYTKTLKKVLRNKRKTFMAGVVLLAASMIFLVSNGVEMLPKFDSGVTYITFEMEPGTTIHQTNETVVYIESLLNREENVLHYDAQVGYEQGSSRMGDFGIMGANQGMITVTLNTRKERSETIWDFQERLRFEISKMPGIQRFVVKEHGGTAIGTSSAPLDLRVSGPDQEIAFYLASQLEDKIRQVDGDHEPVSEPAHEQPADERHHRSSAAAGAGVDQCSTGRTNLPGHGRYGDHHHECGGSDGSECFCRGSPT